MRARRRTQKDVKQYKDFSGSLILVWLATSNLGHLYRLAFSPLELAHVSLFPDLFTQLSLHGDHRDPLVC
jgi:hypothetical protein